MSKKDSKNEAPVFLPFLPIIDFGIEARLKELNKMLDEKPLEPDKKLNIEATIKMYADKVLPKRIGDLSYIQDGKICPYLPDCTRHFLVEGIAMQLGQTAHTPVDQSLLKSSQYFQNVAYPIDNALKGHGIHARIRLVPRFGGDGVSMISIPILNDTGSSIQTIFGSDLLAIGYFRGPYGGNLGFSSVQTANGSVVRPALTIEMQVIRQDGTPVSRWFEEQALIVPQLPNIPRLTGSSIRNVLYFGTAPGNQMLYAAEKKNGLCRQLPVI